MAKDSDNFPPSNLKAPLTNSVIQNRREPTGKKYLMELDGIRHLYHHDEDLLLAKRMRDRLASETGWFENVITHAPTVGSFYEDNIRTMLAELVPNSMKVGTGFIFDPETKRHSKQLDILVSDQSKLAPIYEKGDFSIVTPAMSVFQSEIKKSLTLKDIREIISSTFLSYFGRHSQENGGCHRIAIFAFNCRAKDKKIFDTICTQIEKLTTQFATNTVEGHQAKIALHSIVLPEFYFFDRSTYFLTRLKNSKTSSHIQIEVEKLTSHSSDADSFCEYLSSLGLAIGNSKELQRNNLTLPIHNTGEKRKIAEVLMLKQYSMIELAEHFQRDVEEIRKFTFNAQRPYAVMTPIDIKLSNYTSFLAFKEAKLHWLI